MVAAVDRVARAGRRAWNAVLCCAVLAAGHGTANAYSLAFDPLSQTVSQGGMVGVSVVVSDVLPGGLGSYNLDIAFDDSILAFSSVVDAAGLGLAFGLDHVAAPGTLNLSDFSLEAEIDLLARQSASFTLFTVYFNAVGLGTSALTLSNVILSDAVGAIVGNTDSAGSVTVVAGGTVPLPSTLALLFAAGLAGLLTRGRRPAGRSC